jgi:serine/threonine-protein kinase
MMAATEYGTPKVTDFGLAKNLGATQLGQTNAGSIMGTPSYMAPEQARGDKVDQRADIYAVGGILYRALTGKKPFDSDDPSATLTLVLTEDPERPRAVEASIPQALELVIQRAMAKHPDDRYASMAEFEADLIPFDTDAQAGIEAGAGPTMMSAASATEKVEGGAETVLVAPGQSSGSHTSLLRTTRDAARARPTIALLTVVAYVWVMAGLIDALAGVVRLVRGPNGNVTKPEAVLITLGALAATLTPLILWVRQLARGWGNSVRALQLADGMRRVMTMSIAASGVGALVIRLVQVIVREQAVEVAAPAWSPVLFVLSVLGGGLALLSLRFERRKK